MNTVKFEVSLAPAPDGRPMVLLQAQDRWWSLMTADGARELAEMLTGAADDLDGTGPDQAPVGCADESPYNQERP